MEAYESLERLFLSPSQEIVFIEAVLIPPQKVYMKYSYTVWKIVGTK
jgi:hypothetical protein